MISSMLKKIKNNFFTFNFHCQHLSVELSEKTTLRSNFLCLLPWIIELKETYRVTSFISPIPATDIVCNEGSWAHFGINLPNEMS